MRTAAAIAVGVAVGIGATAIAFFAFGPRQGAPAPTTVVAAAVAGPPAEVPVAVPVEAQPPVQALVPAAPVTPDYGPRVEASPAIYRCRTKTGTVYSNDPCPGARVVDEASAVSGYDTRPSEKLARLVADGRASAPQAPTYRSLRPVAAESRECGVMRRQLRDLDAAMLQPNTLRSLDELRTTRADISTGMTRSRCGQTLP